MIRTVYAMFTDTELMSLATLRDNRSELEIELAQRLELAMVYAEKLKHRLEEHY